MDNLYPIDFDEFYAFLSAHAADAVIGFSCDDGKCPLASFLNIQYEGSTFLVHLTEYERVMDDICLGVEPDVCSALPLWACQFAYFVDSRSNYTAGLPVLAGDALHLLSQVCATWR